MILKSINSAEVVSTDFFLDTTAFHIILFSICWAECLSRWQICVLTAKHKAALLYYKKAFWNTYQNHILKYSLQNVYPKLDFCWASSLGLYCHLFRKRVHFQKEPAAASFVFFKKPSRKGIFFATKLNYVRW